jgi:hypothetical protein
MQHNSHAPTVPPTATPQHSDLPMVMRLKRRLLQLNNFHNHHENNFEAAGILW